MGSHPSEYHVITKIQLYRVNHWSHDVLCQPHPNQHELDIHANHFSSYSSRSEITCKAHKTLQFFFRPEATNMKLSFQFSNATYLTLAIFLRSMSAMSLICLKCAIKWEKIPFLEDLINLLSQTIYAMREFCGPRTMAKDDEGRYACTYKNFLYLVSSIDDMHQYACVYICRVFIFWGNIRELIDSRQKVYRQLSRFF